MLMGGGNVPINDIKEDPVEKIKQRADELFSSK